MSKRNKVRRGLPHMPSVPPPPPPPPVDTALDGLEAERRTLWTQVFLEGVLRVKDFSETMELEDVHPKIEHAAVYASEVVEIWDKWCERHCKGPKGRAR